MDRDSPISSRSYEMGISVDQLESLWPPYRGSILLGTARESQGRVKNARVALTAGHVALSLEVNPATDPGDDLDEASSMFAKVKSTGVDSVPAAQISKPLEHNTSPRTSRPVLRLTVLLDAVPDGAPKPGIYQVTKFLTKVLAASEAGAVEEKFTSASSDAVATGTDFPGFDESALGEDIPEILVVKHEEDVVLSQFIRIGRHRRNLDPEGAAEGLASQDTSSPTLIYACIEANGLLRFWKWGAEGDGWRWSHLNSCNICACREDPLGCRVLTAVFAPESGAGRRHRLLWEQEDLGEGAGLGLAFTPSSYGPSLPPRRVWSRRVTFDLDGSDAHLSGEYQHHHQGEEENGGLPGGSAGRSEIALAFSACILPTGVDTLLGSRLGAWMAAGNRVILNDFSTGRLRDASLPTFNLDPPPISGRVSGENGGDSMRNDGAKFHGGGESRGGDVTEAGVRQWPVQDGGEDRNGTDAHGVDFVNNRDSGTAVIRDRGAEVGVSSTRRRLYSVLDGTGELAMYNHPGEAVHVISLPTGDGNLDVSLRCTLHPPPSAPPRCLAVHLNLVVLMAGEVCSAYDLSTGRLLGKTAIPHCPAYVIGREHYALSAATRPGSSSLPAARDPAFWVSETKHLMGILTASHVLRLRLPRGEARAKAVLAPSLHGQSLTAPTILRHLREYKRAVKGGRAFSEYPPQTSLLPELLGSYDLDSGAGRIEMLEMLRHALAVEEGSCAALYGDERSRSIPPWLLLALVPASQDTADSGRLGKEETAEEVRGALEWRVAESLREIEGVRALMQNRTGSNRPGADMGGAAPGMGSSVARDIAVCSATADPATALFEGTLRKWLMCRRREEHKGGESCTDGEYAWDSKAKGGGRPSGMEDSPPVESDLLSLAFRCEAAGEINAQETPFLRLLLEGFREAPPKSRESRMDDTGEDEVEQGAREASASPSLSTFLCLHLAGDDSSPLFDVACRALFHLRPRQLPLFVERLSNFRAYADRIAANGRDMASPAGAAATVNSKDDTSPSRDHDKPADQELDAKITEISAGGGNSFNDANALETNTNDSTSMMERASYAGGRRDSSSSEDEPKPGLSTAQPRSPTPSLARLFRENEDSASDGPPHAGEGHNGRFMTRTSSATSMEYSTEPVSVPVAATAIPTAGDDPPPPSPSLRRGDDGSPQSPPRPAPAHQYFARALASLPPAVEDGVDGSKRRARLSLLMGARMFTEACRLLRARAWEGPEGRWRDDPGAADAWSAAMRLLSALQRAAVEAEGVERKEGEEGAGFAGFALPGDAVGQLAAVHGSVSLQFRLAFEDSLAETILADSPGRMEMVMRRRPRDLTPISVVRMVRRAVTAAVASPRASERSTVLGGGVVGEQTGKAHQRAVLSASTQTLKRCLLLLFEDDDARKAPGDVV